MNLTPIIEGKFKVLGVMDGEECPSLSFLSDGEDATEASRAGLYIHLETAAREGLDGFSSKIVREASKKDKILEFRKGDLRLFFFKGIGNQLVICTSGVLKSSQRADKRETSRAAKFRKQYFEAHKSGTLHVRRIDDEAQ